MARKTKRIKIPISKPDEFSKLLKAISAQNQLLGNASPLYNNAKIDMTNFDGSRNMADKNRSDSEKFKAESEQTMLDAKTLYGTAKGQNINTPNTLYNMVSTIQSILLVAYKSSEEELSKWGFNVVLGSAKSPVRKPKASKS